MSQRGGSVCSDIRFGRKVFSPMVPPGEADFLVVLAPDQVEPNRWLLKPAGKLIVPDAINPAELPNKKSLNVAMLGYLSAFLDIDLAFWLDSVQGNFDAAFFEANRKAFELGRQAAGKI